MWIHESFANYAENLFVEYHFTQKEAQDYVIGCRKLIRNDTPIIGVYGVNKSGSGDANDDEGGESSSSGRSAAAQWKPHWSGTVRELLGREVRNSE